MPNKNTFSIKPINQLISRYFETLKSENKTIAIDPFVGNSPFREKCLSNDLNDCVVADLHEDALDFLNMVADSSVDLVLFDPPYSPRQISECYRKMKKAVNMQTTQSSFWGNLKKEVARVAKKQGYVITCGWNSGGIGKTLGFSIVEILLVAHGGWHNDTIVTVEQKIE